MGDLGVATTDRFQMREAGRNRLDPERMAAAERLQEVASLLAVGFLRCWLHKADKGDDVGLAFLRSPSEVCAKPSSEGERL